MYRARPAGRLEPSHDRDPVRGCGGLPAVDRGSGQREADLVRVRVRVRARVRFWFRVRVRVRVRDRVRT